MLHSARRDWHRMTHMANPEQLAILQKGTDSWNEWRRSQKQTEVDLSGAYLRSADLNGAYLRSANLSNANLNAANLSYANLRSADLNDANLNAADLSYADLNDANLNDANLNAATLSSADLGDAKLSYADLSGAYLSGADLNAPYLRRANLRSANLNDANLNDANLNAADLRRANLSFANLRNADLRKAKLIEADLRNAKLIEADLGHLNVSAATLGYTVFAAIDLSLATGLESVVHEGPSTIGIDTVFRSKGEIPEIFLRGAGVPDAFIRYAKSLVGSPIEFYSCFISYSTKDQEFADRLYADLQAKGVRCWFAPHDVKGGRKLHEQIDEAIRIHDKLLLILSPHSMSSEWVQTEISKARKREVRDKVRVLFPISLAPFQAIQDWESFDADTGKDSAREIREYFIPDFSNWKDHDSYQKAFERLVKDLKAPAEKTNKTSSGS
jgi:uncharacterized protein YjbI with pentapeptide repeats